MPDLTDAHFLLLAHLRDGMPATLAEVAAAFEVDEDHVAQLWIDLHAAGMIAPATAQ